MKPSHMLLAAVAVIGVSAATARADEMFQPEATLTPLRRDQYALRVITPVPNHCYVAGAVKMGPPATVRITADVVPVRVVLKMRRGGCGQAIGQVRHTHKPIRLGGRTGKTKVLVFAMLDGKVVGSTSVDMPAPPAPPTPPPPPPPPTPTPGAISVKTSDVHAWINRMPPGPASFIVTGTVELPSPGYDVKLVAATPQGFNPKELILDLVVTPRKGVFPQVVTSVTVRFEKASYAGNYTGVLVREPDGDGTQVSVEEVH
ncbi:MAG TPA: hypothetical protein VM261_24345 [Kofleriaceae bacterium]|nr:hypothetical protein [Kofleriaceae bacterium]